MMIKYNAGDVASRMNEHAVRARAGIVNVCVVGSRTCRDAAVVGRVLGRLGNVPLYADAKRIQFICGCAQGADTLGQEWAEQRQFPTFLFPPDYDRYKGEPKHVAPFRRNIQMAVISDIVIAFWDGKSRGTRHMLRTCEDINTQCKTNMHIFTSRTPGFGEWWSNR